MILLTHYFCDFNCLLFFLKNTLLTEVFFSLNLTFIRLTLKGICIKIHNVTTGIEIAFINCILGCIVTWSGSSAYVNNPVVLHDKLCTYYRIHEKLGQQNVVVMSTFRKCCSVTFLRTLF
jgi:hypothetical protein